MTIYRTDTHSGSACSSTRATQLEVNRTVGDWLAMTNTTGERAVTSITINRSNGLTTTFDVRADFERGDRVVHVSTGRRGIVLGDESPTHVVVNWDRISGYGVVHLNSTEPITGLRKVTS